MPRSVITLNYVTKDEDVMASPGHMSYVSHQTQGNVVQCFVTLYQLPTFLNISTCLYSFILTDIRVRLEPLLGNRCVLSTEAEITLVFSWVKTLHCRTYCWRYLKSGKWTVWDRVSFLSFKFCRWTNDEREFRLCILWKFRKAYQTRVIGQIELKFAKLWLYLPPEVGAK